MRKKTNIYLVSLLAALFMVSMLPMAVSAEVVQQIKESFDTFEGLKPGAETYKNAFYAGNRGDLTDYYVESVSGLYGKAADDRSANLKEELRTETTQAFQRYPFFARASSGINGNFQYGDKIRVSFQFALDNLEDWSGNIRFLKLRAAANGVIQTGDATDGINRAVQITKNSISFLNVSNWTEVLVNWAPRKWYRVELVFTPGDGTSVKNKMVAYLDGVQVTNELEFDADRTKAYSQLTGFGEVQFSYDLNGDHTIPGSSSGHTGKSFYIDEYEITHQTTEDELITPVSVQTTDADITSTYKSAFLLSRDMTVGELKEKLSVTGGEAAYYGADGELLSDSDSVSECYLRVTGASGVSYDYFIGRNIALYNEDFDSYLPINNQKYKGFSGVTLNDGVASSGKSGLGGTAANNHSYVFQYENWRNGNKSKSLLKWSRSGKDVISVLQSYTIEFSVLALENETAGNLQFGLNAGGSGEFLAVQLVGGKIVTAADTGWGTVDTGVAYQPNEWHKIAIEVNPVTAKGAVYVDGVKRRENMRLSYSDGSPNYQTTPAINDMVFNMLVNNGAADTTYSGGFAIDDFGVYAGTYHSEQALGTTQFGRAVLFCGETDVSDVSVLPANGMYQVRIPVEKEGIVKEFAYLVLARYDNERLTELRTKKVSILQSDKQLMSETINTSNVTADTSFRIFVWRSPEGMQPLREFQKWGGA